MAIVKQLDHITIFCNSQGDKKHLFGFLTGVLGFPAVNASTVWLGNVAVTLLNFAGGRSPAFKGLCFEPYSFLEAKQSLKEKEFPFFQPYEDAIFFCPDPSFLLSVMRHFTRRSDFLFHNWKSQSIMMMLSERTPRLALWKSKLGVIEVDKVIVSTHRPDHFAAFMNTLTHGHNPILPDEWKLGDTPTIVMQPTGTTGITALHIKVQSLQTLRNFLEEHDLVDEDYPDHLTCTPLGLRFCFVE